MRFFSDPEKEMTSFNKLVGKTIMKIIQYGDEELIFVTSDGKSLEMCHQQYCCENVYIESITGEMQDLIGSSILMADESTNEDPEPHYSSTWTFYKLATINGYVDIRWYGESSGYYSEEVDLCWRDKESTSEYIEERKNRTDIKVWEIKT